ncbi:MAG: hypothetical protein ACE5HE_01525 [Phycisphaerae bacterium]
MSRHKSAVIVLALYGVCSLAASAQEQDVIGRLRAELEAQRAVNSELLQRVAALEASQTAILEKIQAVERAMPDEESVREERQALIEELRYDYFDLQERLNLLPTLSGYYDFVYTNDDREDSRGEFNQHWLSLHLTKEWANWRFFSEVEFEHGVLFEGEGGTALEEARGEVKLEQCWAEHVHSDLLTLRAGLILTPGYWNVNHYPNVVLSTARPLMVRSVFRESFVGLMAYGTSYWGDFGVTYRAYVGNGQSVYFTRHDDNEGKAVGAKVSFHIPTKGKLDQLDLGLHLYHESPSDEDRVLTWGLDAQLRKGPWEVLSELAAKDAEEDRTGFYLQPSYRFNERWAVFYRYDLLEIEHDDRTQEHTVGVNFRPIPEVSLKLEYFHSIHAEDDDYNGVTASIAVAF